MKLKRWLIAIAVTDTDGYPAYDDLTGRFYTRRGAEEYARLANSLRRPRPTGGLVGAFHGSTPAPKWQAATERALADMRFNAYERKSKVQALDLKAAPNAFGTAEEEDAA